MRRKIELSSEAIKEIDAARGKLSREQYLDRLYKKVSGCPTFSHAGSRLQKNETKIGHRSAVVLCPNVSKPYEQRGIGYRVYLVCL